MTAQTGRNHRSFGTHIILQLFLAISIELRIRANNSKDLANEFGTQLQIISLCNCVLKCIGDMLYCERENNEHLILMDVML